jgi:hypothetical protein
MSACPRGAHSHWSMGSLTCKLAVRHRSLQQQQCSLDSPIRFRSREVITQSKRNPSMHVLPSQCRPPSGSMGALTAAATTPAPHGGAFQKHGCRPCRRWNEREHDRLHPDVARWPLLALRAAGVEAGFRAGDRVDDEARTGRQR